MSVATFVRFSKCFLVCKAKPLSSHGLVGLRTSLVLRVGSCDNSDGQREHSLLPPVVEHACRHRAIRRLSRHSQRSPARIINRNHIGTSGQIGQLAGHLLQVLAAAPIFAPEAPRERAQARISRTVRTTA